MRLCLDTSTPYVSVAVADAVGVVRASADRVGPMLHGELLLPTIAEVIEAAGATPAAVSSLLVGVGPGPYTGLRVGVATAVTLAHALSVPIQAAMSLDGLGYAHRDQPEVWATADARRKEIFVARYHFGSRVDDVRVLKPADLDTEGIAVVGAGPQLFPAVFAPASGPDVVTAADLITAVHQGVALTCPVAPIYLRRPDAQTPGPAKHSAKQVS